MQIVRKEFKPGVLILELSGPLQIGVECKQLELAFDELLRENRTGVVLDLSGLTRLDSAGLGKIVNCFSRLKTARGMLRLAGTSGMIEGVLNLAHADRFLKTYPTAREAAESFSDSAASTGP
ncbi:MAG TPA: STAS domain-containing protein [Candidatus Acidoferrum sp.]|nr:STAS domain-containing protein [Candidatus Acidoferrum sp.]